jgi:hypothetical protein
VTLAEEKNSAKEFRKKRKKRRCRKLCALLTCITIVIQTVVFTHEQCLARTSPSTPFSLFLLGTLRECLSSTVSLQCSECWKRLNVLCSVSHLTTRVDWKILMISCTLYRLRLVHTNRELRPDQ